MPFEITSPLIERNQHLESFKMVYKIKICPISFTKLISIIIMTLCFYQLRFFLNFSENIFKLAETDLKSMDFKKFGLFWNDLQFKIVVSVREKFVVEWYKTPGVTCRCHLFLSHVTATSLFWMSLSHVAVTCHISLSLPHAAVTCHCDSGCRD